MGGLRASELPPEILCAGDLIEYYSRQYVCGDSRGHRLAVVLQIDAAPDNPLSVSLDSGDPLPLTNFMRRLVDSAVNRLDCDEVKWRTLRSYSLAPGAVNRPTRANALREALSTAVEDAYASTRAILHGRSEDSSRPSSMQRSVAIPEPSCTVHSINGPRTAKPSAKEVGRVGHEDSTPQQGEVRVRVTEKVVVDLTVEEGRQDMNSTAASVGIDSAEGDVDEIDAATISESPPTDQDIVEAEAYVEAVPTRWMREKLGIRKRNVPAQKVSALLSLPGVKRRLRNLHARRPIYVEASVDDRHSPAEVSWPDGVTKIVECVNPKDIAFKDIGDYDSCECIGDCFMDTCMNVLSAVFCTPDSCKLGANCSNALRARETLKLFDTGRVGLGVFTTTNLDVGDVIGEYAGELVEYNARIEGQPVSALKQNSGYAMLYNTKSVRNKFVYVEALNYGFTTRFISHACDANAAFVEMQNRAQVKVLVKMVKDVKAGAQITVNYGPERWFKCACDDCWTENSDGGSA